jgi:hypothetical protein
MPDTHEFVLISKCEGTCGAASNYPSKIKSAQAPSGDLPIDDENLGSNEKKVIGT